MPVFRDSPEAVLEIDLGTKGVFRLREPDPQFLMERRVALRHRIPLTERIFEFQNLPDGNRRATGYRPDASDADVRENARQVRETDTAMLVHAIIGWDGEEAVNEANAERLPEETRRKLLKEVSGLAGMTEEERAPLATSVTPLPAATTPPPSSAVLPPGLFAPSSSGAIPDGMGGPQNRSIEFPPQPSPLTPPLSPAMPGA